MGKTCTFCDYLLGFPTVDVSSIEIFDLEDTLQEGFVTSNKEYSIRIRTTRTVDRRNINIVDARMVKDQSRFTPPPGRGSFLGTNRAKGLRSRSRCEMCGAMTPFASIGAPP